jgi:hypothetical protein
VRMATLHCRKDEMDLAVKHVATACTLIASVPVLWITAAHTMYLVETVRLDSVLSLTGHFMFTNRCI